MGLSHRKASLTTLFSLKKIEKEFLWKKKWPKVGMEPRNRSKSGFEHRTFGFFSFAFYQLSHIWPKRREEGRWSGALKSVRWKVKELFELKFLLVLFWRKLLVCLFSTWSFNFNKRVRETTSQKAYQHGQLVSVHLDRTEIPRPGDSRAHRTPPATTFQLPHHPQFEQLWSARSR